MRSNSDLHKLIKSMSPQEKRYFKLNAATYARSDTNKTLQLFDIIDRMEHEAEAGRRALEVVENLSSACYRLYNLILATLAQYHAGKSVGAELRAMLSHVEILYDKGLFKQCRKLLQRARKKAERYERFEFMMDIHYWERKNLLKNIGKAAEHELLAHYADVEFSLESLRTSQAYLKLLDQVQILGARYRQVHNPDDRERLLELLEGELLRRPERAGTFVARVSRLETQGLARQILGDYPAAFDCYHQAIRLWQQNEAYIRDNLTRFKDYLNNYLTCCISLRRFADFEQTIGTLKKLPAASRAAEVRMFENVPFLELWYYLNNGRLEDGLALAGEIEARLPDFAGHMRPNRLITLCHNCAILYFLAGRYGKALEMLQRILQMKEIDSRRDIQHFTRVFRLIIHYELEDYAMLESVCTASERYLARQEEGVHYERYVLAAIRKLLNARDRARRERILRDLRATLLELVSATSHGQPPGAVETLFWVESKLRRQDIALTYRQRVRPGSDADIRALFPPEG